MYIAWMTVSDRAKLSGFSRLFCPALAFGASGVAVLIWALIGEPEEVL